MDTLIQLLTDPRFLQVVGPLGIFAIVEGYVIYKLFCLYNESLQKRLDDHIKMKDAYTELVDNINRTLDAVLKVIGRKNGNGNGGNSNG